MKTVSFILFLIVFSHTLYSQNDIFPIDSTTGKITYTEVVKVDSVNSQELYVRAHSWFAHTFVSAQDVIQLDDKDAGMIFGKGTFSVSDNVVNPTMMDVHISGIVDFAIEVQTKDGRYKYVFTDLSFKLLGMKENDLRSSTISASGTYKKKMNMRWQEVRQNTNATILSIIFSLKHAMTANNDYKW